MCCYYPKLGSYMEKKTHSSLVNNFCYISVLTKLYQMNREILLKRSGGEKKVLNRRHWAL